MMEKLVQTLIPLALAKLKDISTEDKRTFAMFIEDLCTAYLNNEYAYFRSQLARTTLDESTQQGIIDALWSTENQTE